MIEVIGVVPTIFLDLSDFIPDSNLLNERCGNCDGLMSQVLLNYKSKTHLDGAPKTRVLIDAINIPGLRCKNINCQKVYWLNVGIDEYRKRALNHYLIDRDPRFKQDLMEKLIGFDRK